MRHQTLYFTCGVCGLQVGTVDNDVDETEEDTEMPPGWIEVTARRVVKNPEFKKPRSLDEHIDEIVGEISKTQGSAPEGVDPRAAVRPHAELQMAIESQSALSEYIVEEVQFHVSPDYTTSLTALDTDAFEEFGWELPQEEKKEEVA
jgi:hypothetical protein